MSEEQKAKVRLYVSMSQEMADFYQEMADSMGISRSTCMVIGLKTYMDQQNLLKLTTPVNSTDFNIKI